LITISNCGQTYIQYTIQKIYMCMTFLIIRYISKVVSLYLYPLSSEIKVLVDELFSMQWMRTNVFSIFTNSILLDTTKHLMLITYLIIKNVIHMYIFCIVYCMYVCPQFEIVINIILLLCRSQDIKYWQNSLNWKKWHTQKFSE
jgi:hypothetical protein